MTETALAVIPETDLTILPHYNAKNIDMKLAYHLYFNEKLSLIEVGKQLNVSGQTILYRFKKLGIKARNKTEWQTGRKRPYLSKEKNPNWKGGKSLTRYGYIKVDANTLEHRVIVQKILGRPLTSKEVIHHIDGNRSNNDPSNLLICSQSEHINIHRKKGDICRKKQHCGTN
jgi:hypothetical protein